MIVRVGDLVQREVEVVIGSEEGRIAEAVDSVGTEEGLEECTLLFGVGRELLWKEEVR